MVPDGRIPARRGFRAGRGAHQGSPRAVRGGELLRARPRAPLLPPPGAGRGAVADRGGGGRAASHDPPCPLEDPFPGREAEMRTALLAAGSAGIAALLLWGLAGLPPFGSYPGPYGDVLNSFAVGERKATDVVSAVNFDYRGFDTLGEEFILFVSVAGAALLLRKIDERKEESREESEEEDRQGGRAPPPTSDATRAFGVALVGLTVVFGLYMISHGQTTPGGGFQGGVILATAPLSVYLCAEARAFQRIAPKWLV